MLGTLSLCGASAAACGYQMYRQSCVRGSKNQTQQIARFRAEYKLPVPVLPITTMLRDVIADRVPLPKESAVSFDLFDTLVGRDVSSPEVIFQLVESKSGISGFAEARKLAGNLFCSPECLGSIHDIYNHISRNPGIMSQPGVNLDRLREMEWQLELEHAVLIQSNIAKLVATSPEKTIIIISDTFYSATKLRELLSYLKMPRLDEITIFASRSGKEDGWVWSILNEYYRITSHMGDNSSTDVSSPLRSKVVATIIHSKMAHSQTAAERLLDDLSKDPNSPERSLGSLIRRLSLGNPYTFEKEKEKFFWYRLYASYTVPCFWYFTQSIKQFLETNPKITRIAAVSRDCILLEPMIRKFLLQGQDVFTSKSGESRTVTLVRLDSSRKLLVDQLKNPNPDYLDYLREVLGTDMKQTLVLDVNGTYRSISDLTKKYLGGVPRAHFLTIQNGSILPQVRGLLTVAIPEIDTNVLEKMNVTRCGSLVEWVGSRNEIFGGPIRIPCEYSEDMIEVSHCMILRDALQVLEKHAPSSLPRSRVMASLLENADRSAGGIQHMNRQVTLQALIPITRPIEREIATHLSRIFSLYHDSSVKLLDTSRLRVPWSDFFKDRLRLVESPDEADIVITTASVEELPSVMSKYKSLLVVYLTGHIDLVDEPRILTCWSLIRGSSLIVFKEAKTRKAEPADIDIDELPDVPTGLTRNEDLEPSHAHMVA